MRSVKAAGWAPVGVAHPSIPQSQIGSTPPAIQTGVQNASPTCCAAPASPVLRSAPAIGRLDRAWMHGGRSRAPGTHVQPSTSQPPRRRTPCEICASARTRNRRCKALSFPSCTPCFSQTEAWDNPGRVHELHIGRRGCKHPGCNFRASFSIRPLQLCRAQQTLVMDMLIAVPTLCFESTRVFARS
jgi:hypothetical protein